MREEFVDPLPALNTNATLVIGKNRVKCVVVDVTVDEFRVAVPDAEHYEGDPRFMLVTGDVIYPVQLALQEAHSGGYSYRLKRLPSDAFGARNGFLKNFYFHHSSIKCIAAGLAVSAIVSFWFIASGADQNQLLCLRSIRRDSSGWWPPSMNDKGKVPPGISIDKSLVVSKDVQSDKQKRVESVIEPTNELNAVSVSLISPASMSVPSLLPQDEPSILQPNSAKESVSSSSNRIQKKKSASLISLLDEGRVGRLRTLVPELIPWLYGSTPSSQLGYFRISDAAFSDLQQFELGLRGMPIEACTEAVERLRRSLRRSSNFNNARTVHGFDDVFVIRSDDADVYFRTRKGMVEIVRVLPTDL